MTKKQASKKKSDEQKEYSDYISKYICEVFCWGVQKTTSKYLSNYFKGLDFGHSAIMLRFPIKGNEGLVNKYLNDKELKSRLVKNKENGTYEFYWSFWPGNEASDLSDGKEVYGENVEKNPPSYCLASLQDDIYWQRRGVPLRWRSDEEIFSRIASAEVNGSSENNLAKIKISNDKVENLAIDKRKAKHRLFGTRTPYTLGPGLTIHFPSKIQPKQKSDNIDEKILYIISKYFAAEKTNKILNKDNIDYDIKKIQKLSSLLTEQVARCCGSVKSYTLLSTFSFELHWSHIA